MEAEVNSPESKPPTWPKDAPASPRGPGPGPHHPVGPTPGENTAKRREHAERPDGDVLWMRPASTCSAPDSCSPTMAGSTGPSIMREPDQHAVPDRLGLSAGRTIRGSPLRPSSPTRPGALERAGHDGRSPRIRSTAATERLRGSDHVHGPSKILRWFAVVTGLRRQKPQPASGRHGDLRRFVSGVWACISFGLIRCFLLYIVFVSAKQSERGVLMQSRGMIRNTVARLERSTDG